MLDRLAQVCRRSLQQDGIIIERAEGEVAWVAQRPTKTTRAVIVVRY